MQKPRDVSRAGIIAVSMLALLLPIHRADAACTITGDETINCDGVTYRAVDDECLHYVDLAAFNAAHPGVPLPSLKKTIAQNYADPAVIRPVVVELTDYVDATGTTHNFQDANLVPNSPFPNQPSRLMNISGKTFRVTASPSNGFATFYYSFDVATGGTAGVPHLLLAESSNDQERYTTLLIHHPDNIVIKPGLPYAPPYTGEPTTEPWGAQNFARTQQDWVFGPDVGLTTYTGRELPITHKPFNIPMIFYPKTTTVRVVVSSLGCNVSRGPSDGGAASRFWVFKFVDAVADRLPQLALPEAPEQRRRIGIYMTHPWFFYAHYGTPARQLAHRQQSLQRMVDHLRYCGMDYIVFNAVNGADRAVKTWYEGSAHLSWNSAGDLLAELPPIAQAAGMQLVPLVTSLVEPRFKNGLTFTDESYQIDSNGNKVTTFNVPALDPLRPEVQQLTYNMLQEIAQRVASNPAVRGIGIRANGVIGTCYIADSDASISARRSGYSSYDIGLYKAATGSAVPTSPPSAAYNYLVNNPAEWEAWINFRCQKTREFWLSCRDLIRSFRSDLIFYVQCDLPSERPGTNIEWQNGETPRNLLRYHGYDPEMFVNDTGIIISRGMMVAADRFFVGSRWAPPHGSNHENYRLFHFAPGLAEMYRTAQGRACEFYQNYWEETFNPYFEYGSPGDPNGFFRTSTPAAPGRAFFAQAIMSVRRQDPDAMTWLGWVRPTLGHEADIRKFAQAFRALPAVTPAPFNGNITPNSPSIVARWHGNRLAVINDTPDPQTITLQAFQPFPQGEELTDVVTGRKLLTADEANRTTLTFTAEAYSLNTFLYTGKPPCPPPTSGAYLGDFDGDRDVDGSDLAILLACALGPEKRPVPSECLIADLDCDEDVDQSDFAIFQRCLSGGGFQPGIECGG